MQTPGIMCQLVAIAAALSVVALSSVASADSFDPMKGGALGWAEPHESSSLRFREYVQTLPELFIRTPPTPGLIEPPKSTIDAKAISWEWPHTKVIFGMHVRRTGASDRVVGALTAADTLGFTQQGILFAGRTGVERGWFRLYSVAGAGGLQLVSYDLGAHETDLFGTTPQVIWSGLLTGGVGAEAQLGPLFSVSSEYDMAMLTLSPGTQLVTPDPRLVIRTWFTGIKVVY